jgi:hypothetical protein
MSQSFEIIWKNTRKCPLLSKLFVFLSIERSRITSNKKEQKWEDIDSNGNIVLRLGYDCDNSLSCINHNLENVISYCHKKNYLQRIQ